MKVQILSLLTFVFAPYLIHASDAPALSLTDEGVGITSVANTFTLAAPSLDLGGKSENPALSKDADTLVAKYASGAELKMTVSDATKVVTCQFSGVPAAAKGFQLRMEIPDRFAGSGRVSFNNKPLVTLPATGTKQVFDQSTATKFNFDDGQGNGFSIVPTQNYQQVQDHRLLGLKTFLYVYNFTFSTNEGKTEFTFKFEPLDASLVAPK